MRKTHSAEVWEGSLSPGGSHSTSWDASTNARR